MPDIARRAVDHKFTESTRKSYRVEIICSLLLCFQISQAFAPSRRHPTTSHFERSCKKSRIRKLGESIDNNSIHTLYAQNPPRRGLLQIINSEVSDLILDKLNEKLSGSNQIPGESSSATSNRSSSKRTNRYKSATAGLSKFHQSILTTHSMRERCVTGQYPIIISVEENPTKKWLAGSRNVATMQMLVNGTSTERSLASYDRFQWLDDDERSALEGNSLFSFELLAEINVRKPGYINILPASDAGFAAKKEKDETDVLKNTYRLTYDEQDESYDQNTGNAGRIPSKRELLERTLEAEKERVWITGFSITKQSGELNFVDVESGKMGHISKETASDIRWPNEVNTVPVQNYKNGSPSMQLPEEDALLVSDGFLVPGKDNGGVYVVLQPGHDRNEFRACLAGGNGVDGQLNKLETRKNDKNTMSSIDDDGWFYHRSIWIDLTGDGRQSVLTARAKRPSLLKEENDPSPLPTKAQLVWLERPQPFAYDKATGTPLDKDGLVFNPFSPKHTPWKVRVLDEGPDVMFSVADLDTSDSTVEVFASQFFNKKLTLHSICIGPKPKVVFRRTLDDRCGAAFSSILANLDTSNNLPTRLVVDSGSTVPTLQRDESFSHLLITSHECTYAEDKKGKATKFDHKELEYNNELKMGNEEDKVDGGSLFSYRVPAGKNAWKTEPWIRSVIATGFRVDGQLGNMINPGAPGFCYTFYPTKDGPTTSIGSSSRPLIGIAGDCAESAYFLRPCDSKVGHDPSSNYALMCEIKCGATVGSIGIGYEDFCHAPQQKDYAKIYIPCYEMNKVLVFSLGNGEDDVTDGW